MRNKLEEFKEILKMKSQLFFMIISTFVFGFAPYALYNASIQRTWLLERYPTLLDHDWPVLSDFYITIVSCLFIYISNFLVKMLTYDFFYRNCKEKIDEELRVSKTLKACSSFYKAIYYICVVIWGYNILKD